MIVPLDKLLDDLVNGDHSISQCQYERMSYQDGQSQN